MRRGLMLLLAVWLVATAINLTQSAQSQDTQSSPAQSSSAQSQAAPAPPAAPSQAAPSQPAPPDASARTEERIIKQVRHELLMLPYVTPFDNFSYRVDGYTVTLMGQVVRPNLKSDAGNAIKHIEGVEKVDNQIEVLPTSIMDDRLRRRLYRVIYGYPGFEKYAMVPQKPIRIIVKNGNVTLEGVVDSEGDKTIAGIRANQAATFTVTNNLQVVKP